MSVLLSLSITTIYVPSKQNLYGGFSCQTVCATFKNPIAFQQISVKEFSNVLTVNTQQTA